MMWEKFVEEAIINRSIDDETAGTMETSPISKNHGVLVGKNVAFQNAVALARQVAPTPTPVLITGEIGTGKELIAQAIHNWSPRRQKPLIRVNCAAFSAELVERELFGRFELAQGGSLFLDEIGAMPVESQSKLLRVLQDGMVDRLGGKQPVPVDVRVIAATNSDLCAAVKRGAFRADLFYRVSVFPLDLPPLRDRLDDISLLAQYFLEQYCVKFKRSCKEIDQESLERLIRHPWPGNICELENVIERALILSHEPVLRINEQILGSQGTSFAASPPSDLKELGRRHILQTLTLTEWHIEGPDGAAARLGLPPSTLRSRMKQFGMKRPPAN
jgi:formate hydrogenlyase transcriptional activator